MLIQERGARLSAMIGAMTQVLMILSLFLMFSRTTSAFFPDQPSEISGWEAVASSVLFPPGILEYLFLASIFWPLLFYLCSVWMLFKKQKHKWLVLLGGVAIQSLLLAILGFTLLLPLFLFVVTGTHMGHEASSMYGPAFWFSPPAFCVSSCCSLLLAMHFLSDAFSHEEG